MGGLNCVEHSDIIRAYSHNMGQKELPSNPDIPPLAGVRAYLSGKTVSHDFRCESAQERAWFEKGLTAFLGENGLGGISAAEISDPVVLKGFVWALKSLGIADYDDEDLPDSASELGFPNYDADLFAARIGDLDWQGLNGDEKAETERSKLMEGAGIAADYVKFAIFLPEVHGIDQETLPDDLLKRYFNISRKIYSDLAPFRDEYAAAVNLYKAKFNSFRLKEIDYEAEIQEIDYLTFVLDIIDYADPEGNELDVLQERQEVEGLECDLYNRAKDPRVFDLQAELEGAVQREEYELAARLRDELKQIKTSYEKKASEK